MAVCHQGQFQGYSTNFRVVARSAATYGRPAKPRRLCHLWQSEPPENQPFQLKEKYGGGKFKNESKAGFSGGAQRALAAGAELQPSK